MDRLVRAAQERQTRDAQAAEIARGLNQVQEAAEARYRDGYHRLLAELEEILVEARARIDLPLPLERHRDNTALVRLPGIGNVVWLNLVPRPRTPMESPLGEIWGAAYFGDRGRHGGVDPATVGANFLWVRRPEDDAAAERWVGCLMRLSGAVPGERVADRHGISVPPDAQTPFGIDRDDVLYDQLKHLNAMHTITFQIAESTRSVFLDVLTTALSK